MTAGRDKRDDNKFARIASCNLRATFWGDFPYKCLMNIARIIGEAQQCAAHGLYRPTRQRRRVPCPAYEGTSGPRTGSRCDPHLASTEKESGYTEFPARGYNPPSGLTRRFGASGSRWTPKGAQHTARRPHHGPNRSQVTAGSAPAPRQALIEPRHSGKGFIGSPEVGRFNG